MKDVIVIGSGPAGFTAGLYAARANMSTLIITGNEFGGQVATTWEIENYPGIHEPTTGAELTERFVTHVEKFGAELLYDEATSVEFGGPTHRVSTHAGDHEARSVVIAVGASARHLGVPGENELVGRGVSYCATCDGAFFKNQDVLVVGGGDSALEEGIFLTRFASTVRVLHRRDELRAGPALEKRARANEKIDFVWNTVVDEIVGEGKVSSVRVRNVATGDRAELAAGGVFIFIGHDPNSAFLEGAVELDGNGYVVVDDHMRTNVPGVFAAGEIMDPRWRQVATSVGQGAAAGIACQHYVDALD